MARALFIASLSAVSFLFCATASAKCIVVPSVLSVVRVDSCQVAQFKNSFEASQSGVVFESNTTSEGVVIRVQIIKSWLAWRRQSDIRKPNAEYDPKPNRESSSEVYFLHGEPKATCDRTVGKQVTLASADLCCDNGKDVGSCAVQLNQAFLLSNTTNYFPVTEKK